jgi:hypothetical protein
MPGIIARRSQKFGLAQACQTITITDFDLPFRCTSLLE